MKVEVKDKCIGAAMIDRMDAVQIQRDKLKMVLEELFNGLSNGVLNGILPEECPRKKLVSPKDKCKNGKTRREVQLCMGTCCKGCYPIGQCHLSFEEYNLFKAMGNAMDVIKDQPAEMPVVIPEDFPLYDCNTVYNPSARWIARQLYRFAVGYWLFANHSDKEQEKDWERAYNDILSISLRDKGPIFRKMTEVASKIKDPVACKKWLDENKDVCDLQEEAAKSIHEPVNGEKDVDRLVLKALTLRMDYRFGHDYPGGDMGVYDGVFCGIIDDCLTIAGLKPANRPGRYDFEDDDEFRRKLLSWEHEQKNRIYAFMLETGGMGMV